MLTYKCCFQIAIFTYSQKFHARLAFKDSANKQRVLNALEEINVYNDGNNYIEKGKQTHDC